MHVFLLRRARTLAFALLLIEGLGIHRAPGETAGALREVFEEIAGGALSDLTNNPAFPGRPAFEEIRPNFDAPAQWGENYGTRLRALLVPPATGNYTFWIASDDQGALFLGTNEDPASARRIAWVNTWTSEREWTKEANQKSAAIRLESGRRYYLEALQKEGGGGDNLSVRWQLPNGTIIEPIRGTNLVVVGLQPPQITRQPTPTTAVEGSSTAFTIGLSRLLGAHFQWARNGQPIPDATNATFVFGPVRLSDDAAQFRVVVTNSIGAVTSQVARLTVARDVTPPVPLAVANLGDPRRLTLLFSEPLESATASVAANYSLDRGAQILSARLGADPATVILTTSPLVPDGDFVLAVRNVRDQASQPNPVTAGAQVRFGLAIEPLDPTRLDGPPEPPGPSNRRGPLMISEIHYHPAPRADGRNTEFIEVYNPEPWPESLGGWRVSGDVTHRFGPEITLPARGYLVLAANPADVEAVYGIHGVVGYSGRLRGGTGTVRLRNPSEAIVWETTYRDDPPWPAAADGAGHSLVLARPSFGEHDPRAWRASDLPGGSPGAPETWTAPRVRTVRLNEILAHTDDPEKDFIELYNYSPNDVVLDDCALTDDARTNRFVIPTGTIIPARGFLVFDQDQLGFALDAAGETILFREASSGRVLDALRFRGQANGVATGRFPDGAPDFTELTSPTPGSRNATRRTPAIVLNEIMYEPADGAGDGEYVELRNRGDATVSLAGWRLDGGIQFTFPATAALGPGELLVVARDATALRARYPGLDPARCLGDFDGSLGNSGDTIRLTQPDTLVTTNGSGRTTTNVIHIRVDEAEYRAGGRWPAWAAGGGSSLERLDARVDGQRSAAWVASDETRRSDWVTVTATGTLDLGVVTPSALEVLLLGAGECLLDDVEVFLGAGANRVPNGDFSNGLAGWIPQGNQAHSELSLDGGTGGSPCLRLRATGRGDTANRVLVPLTSALPTGQRATIRAKARWLRGASHILLRLHGNWLEATTNLLTTRALGTPAQPNSQAANAGPSIADVLHQPVLPLARQAVTVSARVEDPDGLASLLLRYRVEPATNYTAVAMVHRGAGYFSAVLPGQPAGSLAAFYVEAVDAADTPAVARFPAEAPAREALVRWGDPTASAPFAAYRFWLTQRTIDAWKKQARLGNDLSDITFVLGRDRVIYNAGARYSGSPYHAPGYDSPVGNYCDYQITLPEDDVLLGDTELNLLQAGNGCCEGTLVREQAAYAIARQLGVPYNHTRHVHVFANGQRRSPMLMLDSQQANGEFTRQWWPDADGGDLHKIALWFEFNDDQTGFDATGASFGNFTSGGVKKLARYRWNWPRRAAQHDINNYTNLFALHDALLNTASGDTYTRRLESMVDPDNWARTVAMEHLIGNADSFAYGGGQNMFVFKPTGGRWSLLLWDIDFAFQADPPTANVFSFGGAELNRFLRHPPFFRMYYRALREAVDGPLAATFMNPFLDAREAAFKSAGFTPESPSSIKSYVAARLTSILKDLSRVAAPFRLTSAAPLVASANPVALQGVAPIEAVTVLVEGTTWPVQWTTLTNWTLRLSLSPGVHSLSVTAVDATGRPVADPATVTVDFQGSPDPALGSVFVNEWMADNRSTLANPADGQFDDWFELHNAGPVSIALGGYYLANATTNRTQWRIPDGTTLPAGGFVVVWADGQTNASTPTALHAGFRLNRDGETIALFSPTGLLLDHVEFDAQTTDVSAGRFPDGTGPAGALLRPTPGRANSLLLADATPRLQVEADASAGVLHLIWQTSAGARYRVEHTDDVAGGTWETIETVTASGPSAALSLDLHADANGFFRIVLD